MDARPVQYVTSSDGTRIAYAVTGEGAPLVFLPVPQKAMDIAWDFPRPLRPWLEGLAARFRVIQYDNRGSGLSTRDVATMHMADFVHDLEAVVERLAIPRFVMLAATGFGHVALRYAVAHPERIEALVILNSPVSGEAFSQVQFDSLPEAQWKVFLRSTVPAGLTLDDNSRYLEAILENTSQENGLAGLRATRESNVEDILPLVKAPTLVMRSRDLLQFPVEESRRMAAAIPDARMVVLDGEGYFPDPEQGLQALDDFLSSLPQGSSGPAPTLEQGAHGLSAREVEVLQLIATGRTNPQIAHDLVISRSTVQNHVSSILTKAGLANRTEAAAYAQRHGLT